MILSLKHFFVSFFGFLKSKTFFGYALSVLIAAIIFFYSGYALTNSVQYRTYFNVLLVLFAIILTGYFLITLKIPNEKKSPKNIIKYMLSKAKYDIPLYFLIFVILSMFISMVVNNDFNNNALKTFMTTAATFIAAFSFVKVVKIQTVIHIYRKVFPWLCLVSLMMFGLVNIFTITHPHWTFSTQTATYYDNYLFVYFKYITLLNRNCSIFWEPALFALFICVGIVFEIVFTDKKFRMWIIALYLGALFTTFSASGFVLMFLVFILSVSLSRPEVIKENFVKLLIVVFICSLAIVVVYFAAPGVIAKFRYSGINGSLMERLYGPYINMKIMVDHPFGVGFSNEYNAFVEYASELKVVKSFEVQTCAFGYWMSAFGFPGALFTLIPLVLLFFIKKIDLLSKILIVPFVFLMMMAEPIQFNLLFIIMIFYVLKECPLLQKQREEKYLPEECSSISQRIFKNSKNSIFVRNSTGAFVVKGLAMLVSLFTTSAYISYFVDPAGDGMLAVWFTILSILTWILVFDLGVGHGLKNKLIAAYEDNDDNRARNLISSSYVSTLVISLLLFTAGSFVIWFTNTSAFLNVKEGLIDPTSLKLSLWIILLAICLNFVLKIVCNIFESLQKQGLSNSFAIFQTITLLIFVGLFSFDTNEARMLGLSIAYLVASTVPLLIGSLILFATTFKKYRPSIKYFSLEGAKDVVSLGGLFFVIQICMLLINSTNTFILQQIYADIDGSATSQFTYYHKIFNIVVTVSQLLSGPLWVIIAKAKSSGDSSYIKKMNKLMYIFIGSFVAIDALLFALMPIVFELWIPNAEFTFSWSANAIFAVNSVIATSTILFAAISNGLSKLRYQMAGFILGVFIKAGLVAGIAVSLNKGNAVPWYYIELTTTAAYLPVLLLVPIGNYKYLRLSELKPNRVFFFSYFSNLVGSNRNAPLASESISLYIKELLDNRSDLDYVVEYVNLAHSRKAFSIEKNRRFNSNHQIGTVCFGRIYRKFIWKKIYWRRVYRFCKNNVTKDNVVIIYHSLYTSHLIKKIKNKIGCKVILLGAELYSDVSGNKRGHKLEIESYENSNAHILISNTLRKNLNIIRPSLILSGDYRQIEYGVDKWSKDDGLVHLVYAGTFDSVKGGVYASIDAMKFLDNKYVLHILGFGDEDKVKDYIASASINGKIVFEGNKSGQEFIDFISKCDVGLSVQNVSKEFNNSSFPSKIIMYAKCGLAVVSTKAIAVIDSPFKDIVNFANDDSGEAIAEAIKNASSKNNSLELINKLNDEFAKSFYKLLKEAFAYKRVLITNNCYGGSTGNLARQISNYLIENGHDCKFCYLVGKKSKTFYHKRYGFRFEHYLCPLITRITGNNLGLMFLSTSSLKRITRKYQPDLVNPHCMNSYSVNIFGYLKFLEKKKYRVVITNHALFYATGSCGHPYGECDKYLSGCGKCPNKRYACKSLVFDRTKKNYKSMKKVLSNSDFTMTSVSDYVRDFCSSSPITSSLKNETILNGIDVSIFNFKDTKFDDGKVHILHVTSTIKGKNKGFDEFIKIVKEFENNDKFVFHVVGDNNKKSPKLNNVIYHGRISNKIELAELYSKCDLYLLVSRRETFSLPVVESLCCGTPIVGYKCGGPESFVNSSEGTFFDNGDYKSVVEYIKNGNYLSLNKKELSDASAIKYSSNSMCASYFNTFIELLNNN